MTSASDVPALGELARLAQECLDRWAEYVATPNDSTRCEHSVVHEDFRAACTPRAILQLVALATGGADSELLDGLLDDALSGMREPMTLADARDVRDMLTRVQVERKKAKVRAARSLTPERPADAC